MSNRWRQPGNYRPYKKYGMYGDGPPNQNNFKRNQYGGGGGGPGDYGNNYHMHPRHPAPSSFQSGFMSHGPRPPLHHGPSTSHGPHGSLGPPPSSHGPHGSLGPPPSSSHGPHGSLGPPPSSSHGPHGSLGPPPGSMGPHGSLGPPPGPSHGGFGGPHGSLGPPPGPFGGPHGSLGPPPGPSHGGFGGPSSMDLPSMMNQQMNSMHPMGPPMQSHMMTSHNMSHGQMDVPKVNTNAPDVLNENKRLRSMILRNLDMIHAQQQMLEDQDRERDAERKQFQELKEAYEKMKVELMALKKPKPKPVLSSRAVQAPCLRGLRHRRHNHLECIRLYNLMKRKQRKMSETSNPEETDTEETTGEADETDETDETTNVGIEASDSDKEKVVQKDHLDHKIKDKDKVTNKDDNDKLTENETETIKMEDLSETLHKEFPNDSSTSAMLEASKQEIADDNELENDHLHDLDMEEEQEQTRDDEEVSVSSADTFDTASTSVQQSYEVIPFEKQQTNLKDLVQSQDEENSSRRPSSSFSSSEENIQRMSKDLIDEEAATPSSSSSSLSAKNSGSGLMSDIKKTGNFFQGKLEDSFKILLGKSCSQSPTRTPLPKEAKVLTSPNALAATSSASASASASGSAPTSTSTTALTPSSSNTSTNNQKVQNFRLEAAGKTTSSIKETSQNEMSFDKGPLDESPMPALNENETILSAERINQNEKNNKGPQDITEKEKPQFFRMAEITFLGKEDRSSSPTRPPECSQNKFKEKSMESLGEEIILQPFRESQTSGSVPEEKNLTGEEQQQQQSSVTEETSLEDPQTDKEDLVENLNQSGEIKQEILAELEEGSLEPRMIESLPEVEGKSNEMPSSDLVESLSSPSVSEQKDAKDEEDLSGDENSADASGHKENEAEETSSKEQTSEAFNWQVAAPSSDCGDSLLDLLNPGLVESLPLLAQDEDGLGKKVSSNVEKSFTSTITVRSLASLLQEEKPDDKSEEDSFQERNFEEISSSSSRDLPDLDLAESLPSFLAEENDDEAKEDFSNEQETLVDKMLEENASEGEKSEASSTLKNLEDFPSIGFEDKPLALFEPSLIDSLFPLLDQEDENAEEDDAPKGEISEEIAASSSRSLDPEVLDPEESVSSDLIEPTLSEEIDKSKEASDIGENSLDLLETNSIQSLPPLLEVEEVSSEQIETSFTKDLPEPSLDESFSSPVSSGEEISEKISSGLTEDLPKPSLVESLSSSFEQDNDTVQEVASEEESDAVPQSKDETEAEVEASSSNLLEDRSRTEAKEDSQTHLEATKVTDSKKIEEESPSPSTSSSSTRPQSSETPKKFDFSVFAQLFKGISPQDLKSASEILLAISESQQQTSQETTDDRLKTLVGNSKAEDLNRSVTCLSVLKNAMESQSILEKTSETPETTASVPTLEDLEVPKAPKAHEDVMESPTISGKTSETLETISSAHALEVPEDVMESPTISGKTSETPETTDSAPALEDPEVPKVPEIVMESPTISGKTSETPETTASAHALEDLEDVMESQTISEKTSQTPETTAFAPALEVPEDVMESPTILEKTTEIPETTASAHALEVLEVSKVPEDLMESPTILEKTSETPEKTASAPVLEVLVVPTASEDVIESPTISEKSSETSETTASAHALEVPEDVMESPTISEETSETPETTASAPALEFLEVPKVPEDVMESPTILEKSSDTPETTDSAPAPALDVSEVAEVVLKETLDSLPKEYLQDFSSLALRVAHLEKQLQAEEFLEYEELLPSSKKTKYDDNQMEEDVNEKEAFLQNLLLSNKATLLKTQQQKKQLHFQASTNQIEETFFLENQTTSVEQVSLTESKDDDSLLKDIIFQEDPSDQTLVPSNDLEDLTSKLILETSESQISNDIVEDLKIPSDLSEDFLLFSGSPLDKVSLSDLIEQIPEEKLLDEVEELEKEPSSSYFSSENLYEVGFDEFQKEEHQHQHQHQQHQDHQVVEENLDGISVYEVEEDEEVFIEEQETEEILARDFIEEVPEDQIKALIEQETEVVETLDDIQEEDDFSLHHEGDVVAEVLEEPAKTLPDPETEANIYEIPMDELHDNDQTLVPDEENDDLTLTESLVEKISPSISENSSLLQFIDSSNLQLYSLYDEPEPETEPEREREVEAELELEPESQIQKLDDSFSTSKDVSFEEQQTEEQQVLGNEARDQESDENLLTNSSPEDLSLLLQMSSIRMPEEAFPLSDCQFRELEDILSETASQNESIIAPGFERERYCLNQLKSDPQERLQTYDPTRRLSLPLITVCDETFSFESIRRTSLGATRLWPEEDDDQEMYSPFEAPPEGTLDTSVEVPEGESLEASNNLAKSSLALPFMESFNYSQFLDNVGSEVPETLFNEDVLKNQSSIEEEIPEPEVPDLAKNSEALAQNEQNVVATYVQPQVPALKPYLDYFITPNLTPINNEIEDNLLPGLKKQTTSKVSSAEDYVSTPMTPAHEDIDVIDNHLSKTNATGLSNQMLTIVTEEKSLQESLSALSSSQSNTEVCSYESVPLTPALTPAHNIDQTSPNSSPMEIVLNDSSGQEQVEVSPETETEEMMEPKPSENQNLFYELKEQVTAEPGVDSIVEEENAWKMVEGNDLIVVEVAEKEIVEAPLPQSVEETPSALEDGDVGCPSDEEYFDLDFIEDEVIVDESYQKPPEININDLLKNVKEFEEPLPSSSEEVHTEEHIEEDKGIHRKMKIKGCQPIMEHFMDSLFEESHTKDPEEKKEEKSVQEPLKVIEENRSSSKLETIRLEPRVILKRVDHLVQSLKEQKSLQIKDLEEIFDKNWKASESKAKSSRKQKDSPKKSLKVKNQEPKLCKDIQTDVVEPFEEELLEQTPTTAAVVMEESLKDPTDPKEDEQEKSLKVKEIQTDVLEELLEQTPAASSVVMEESLKDPADPKEDAQEKSLKVKNQEPKLCKEIQTDVLEPFEEELLEQTPTTAAVVMEESLKDATKDEQEKSSLKVKNQEPKLCKEIQTDVVEPFEEEEFLEQTPTISSVAMEESLKDPAKDDQQKEGEEEGDDCSEVSCKEFLESLQSFIKALPNEEKFLKKPLENENLRSEEESLLPNAGKDSEKPEAFEIIQDNEGKVLQGVQTEESFLEKTFVADEKVRKMEPINQVGVEITQQSIISNEGTINDELLSMEKSSKKGASKTDDVAIPFDVDFTTVFKSSSVLKDSTQISILEELKEKEDFLQDPKEVGVAENLEIGKTPEKDLIAEENLPLIDDVPERTESTELIEDPIPESESLLQSKPPSLENVEDQEKSEKEEVKAIELSDEKEREVTEILPEPESQTTETLPKENEIPAVPEEAPKEVSSEEPQLNTAVPEQTVALIKDKTNSDVLLIQIQQRAEKASKFFSFAMKDIRHMMRSEVRTLLRLDNGKENEAPEAGETLITNKEKLIETLVQTRLLSGMADSLAPREFDKDGKLEELLSSENQAKGLPSSERLLELIQKSIDKLADRELEKVSGQEKKDKPPAEPEKAIGQEEKEKLLAELEKAIGQEQTDELPAEPEKTMGPEQKDNLPAEPEKAIGLEQKDKLPAEPEEVIGKEQTDNLPEKPEISIGQKQKVHLTKEPEKAIGKEQEDNLPEEREKAIGLEQKDHLPAEPEKTIGQEQKVHLTKEPEKAIGKEQKDNLPEKPEISIGQKQKDHLLEEPEKAIGLEQKDHLPEEPEKAIGLEQEDHLLKKQKTKDTASEDEVNKEKLDVQDALEKAPQSIQSDELGTGAESANHLSNSLMELDGSLLHIPEDLPPIQKEDLASLSSLDILDMITPSLEEKQKKTTEPYVAKIPYPIQDDFEKLSSDKEITGDEAEEQHETMDENPVEPRRMKRRRKRKSTHKSRRQIRRLTKKDPLQTHPEEVLKTHNNNEILSSMLMPHLNTSENEIKTDTDVDVRGELWTEGEVDTETQLPLSDDSFSSCPPCRVKRRKVDKPDPTILTPCYTGSTSPLSAPSPPAFIWKNDNIALYPEDDDKQTPFWNSSPPALVPPKTPGSSPKRPQVPEPSEDVSQTKTKDPQVEKALVLVPPVTAKGKGKAKVDASTAASTALLPSAQTASSNATATTSRKRQAQQQLKKDAKKPATVVAPPSQEDGANKSSKRGNAMFTTDMYCTREWVHDNYEPPEEEDPKKPPKDKKEKQREELLKLVEKLNLVKRDPTQVELPPVSSLPEGCFLAERPAVLSDVSDDEVEESINDMAYLDRHLKDERLEKKSKRIDNEMWRNEQLKQIQKKKDPKEQTEQKPFTSFFPSFSDLRAVQFETEVPVHAFGECMYELPAAGAFRLPWADGVSTDPTITLAPMDRPLTPGRPRNRLPSITYSTPSSFSFIPKRRKKRPAAGSKAKNNNGASTSAAANKQLANNSQNI